MNADEAICTCNAYIPVGSSRAVRIEGTSCFQYAVKNAFYNLYAGCEYLY